MTSYRRILVPIFRNGQSEELLHAVKDLSVGQRPQVLVVRLIDARSGFDSDGPAGRLPGDIGSRKAMDALRRLDLQLARHNLAWVETRALWRDPEPELAKLIDGWRPDLIVTRRDQLPGEVPSGVAVLHTAGRSFLRQLAEAFLQPATGGT